MSVFTGTRMKRVFLSAAVMAALTMLLGAPFAFAAETQEQPVKKNVYKETPPGPKSEAYGDSKYGPDHLRRISPTERQPAAPQVEKTIPLSGGKP